MQSWMSLFCLCVITPCFILLYGAPTKTEDGDEIEDEYSSYPAPIAYVKRAYAYVAAPSFKKLLPDHFPQYQPRLTLVMELTDLFVHPTYDPVRGWRYKKRPGIDYFLNQVSLLSC